jgi:hypothetical protein
MKRSTRVLLAGVVLEALLGGIGWYLIDELANGNLTASTSQSETVSTITTIIGMAMGGLAGLVAVIYIVLRRGGN